MSGMNTSGSIWRGIPLSKAIIVRHTPNDKTSSSKNSGAISMEFAKRGNNYIGRYEQWEQKGDIERACTQADEYLMSDYRERIADGHTLDYIARVGMFESKGEGRQVDASLWNQYGPVDVAEIGRQMCQDGGAFIDSIVTVKREYAEALGLSSKDDMQRLIRSTWTDSVSEWGLIKHASDIRWVASYHTDAEQSLHCHIHTWSAKGEIKPGTTIAPDATRRAKEVVYRDGYATIRQERDRRATYLRDLSVQEAKRQLGYNVKPEQERRLSERAEQGKWPERLSKESDISDHDRKKLEDLSDKLRQELQDGHGRLANNYQAQATARDIVKRLGMASPSFERLNDEYLNHAEAKAAIKGYGDASAHTRDTFIRAEMQDRTQRIANEIIRDHMPKDFQKRELRADLQRLDARGVEGHENISFSLKIAQPGSDTVQARIPGTSQDPEYVVFPTSETGTINRGQGYLVDVETGRDYSVVDTTGSEIDKINGAQVIERFGGADMDRITNYNPETGMTPEQEQEQEQRRVEAARRAEKRREEAQRQLRQDQLALNPATLCQQNTFSVKHGMTLGDTSQLGRDASMLTSHIRGSGVNTYEQLSAKDRVIVDRMSEDIATKSSEVKDTLRQTAEYSSTRTGIPKEKCFEMLQQEAIYHSRDKIVEHAEAGSFHNAPEGRSTIGGASPIDDFAYMVESLVESIGLAESNAARHRSHTKTLTPSMQPEREIEHDR